MNNQKFYDLVEMIFNKAFNIKKHANNNRGGDFTDFFPSNQLERDLKCILEDKTLRDPSIYVGAINQFFDIIDADRIKQLSMLIEALITNDYLIGIDNTHITDVININNDSIDHYRKLLLDVWYHYLNQYNEFNNTHSISDIPYSSYSIAQNSLDELIGKNAKFRLPATLNFYQKRIPEIQQYLSNENLSNVDPYILNNIEIIHIDFFKNVIENDSFDKLSEDEKIIFYNNLYIFSDILDKIHHEDSYTINLEVLSFLNTVYKDDFSKASIDNVRRVQGCIYAIAIENTEESLRGNIELTPNGNITCNNNLTTSITRQKKLDMCIKALKNLLINENIKRLDDCLENTGEISVYQNRYEKHRDITREEINVLYILSLIYSNIAACTLNYIKYKIDLDKKRRDYEDICEIYQEKAQYIRNLLVHITEKYCGVESPEYIDSLHSMANNFNSMATRFFYAKNYANAIAVRSILYNFYMSLDLKKKAQQQLDLAPFIQYEEYGGNSKKYEISTRKFFSKSETYFAYLTNDIISYDEFHNIYLEYQVAKKFL